jgi:hypothetical protein
MFRLAPFLIQFPQGRPSHNLIASRGENGCTNRRAGVAKVDFAAPSVCGAAWSHDGGLEAAA